MAERSFRGGNDERIANVSIEFGQPLKEELGLACRRLTEPAVKPFGAERERVILASRVHLNATPGQRLY
jgi:hypothetical protein